MLKEIIAVATLAVSLHASAFRLVDASTKAVMPLAAITDRSGNVVGMTDNNGEGCSHRKVFTLMYNKPSKGIVALMLGVSLLMTSCASLFTKSNQEIQFKGVPGTVVIDKKKNECSGA